MGWAILFELRLQSTPPTTFQYTSNTCKHVPHRCLLVNKCVHRRDSNWWDWMRDIEWETLPEKEVVKVAGWVETRYPLFHPPSLIFSLTWSQWWCLHLLFYSFFFWFVCQEPKTSISTVARMQRFLFVWLVSFLVLTDGVAGSQ